MRRKPVSLSRLVLLILVVATVVLAMFACAPADRENVTSVTLPKDRGTVKKVPGLKDSLIVEVYVVGTCATPDTAELHVNARSRKGHAGGHLPSVITWIGPPGQMLRIEWKDSNQKGMRKEICCAGARCQAITNIDFLDPVPARSEYRVWIEGVTQPCDPVVIVDNCCDN
jgi:hypothetical protein